MNVLILAKAENHFDRFMPFAIYLKKEKHANILILLVSLTREDISAKYITFFKEIGIDVCDIFDISGLSIVRRIFLYNRTLKKSSSGSKKFTKIGSRLHHYLLSILIKSGFYARYILKGKYSLIIKDYGSLSRHFAFFKKIKGNGIVVVSIPTSKNPSYFMNIEALPTSYRSLTLYSKESSHIIFCDSKAHEMRYLIEKDAGKATAQIDIVGRMEADPMYIKAMKQLCHKSSSKSDCRILYLMSAAFYYCGDERKEWGTSRAFFYNYLSMVLALADFFPNIRITIRQHPNFQSSEADLIVKSLRSERVCVDSQEILFKQILEHDIVISDYTGAVIYALNAGKPIIMIGSNELPNKWREILLLENDFIKTGACYNAYSISDMVRIVGNLIESNYHVPDSIIEGRKKCASKHCYETRRQSLENVYKIVEKKMESLS